MIFWLGILVGASFGWFGYKRGFYESWALLFNILISIYLAVFLGPIIADKISISGSSAYNNAMCMIVTAIVSFLILHGLSYTFLTSQFIVPFPKIFDTAGAGLLGFLAGFLVWSFLVLLVSATPISKSNFVKGIVINSGLEEGKKTYLSKWCNLVNSVVSNRNDRYTAEYAISNIFKKSKERAVAKRAKAVETTEPNEPAGPNEVEILTKELEELGPPPEPSGEDI